MFTACKLKKHSIKCSLIRLNGMYNWPLYIQKNQNGVSTPTCDHHQTVFRSFPFLLYNCLKSYREKKHLFLSERPSDSEVVAWAHSKQCLTRYCLNSYPLVLSCGGDNTTNRWPSDTQLEVMRQLRLQATLFNSLSLTLHHWINIMLPMRVRHWDRVKRELGKILSHR